MMIVFMRPRDFFIEDEGQDGIFQSNSSIVEKHFGRTGLLVEPVRSFIGKCWGNRPKLAGQLLEMLLKRCFSFTCS